MKNSITASISPETAAKLVIANEIDLSDNLSREQSLSVVEALLSISLPCVLHITDQALGTALDTNYVPQFGSIESIDKVPFCLIETGGSYLTYAQLGLYLKNDINAKLEANIKFGENHGKGASVLGLAICNEKRISCSSLSKGFCEISSPITRQEVIKKLYFRIPIVQLILRQAAIGKYNAYDSMPFFTESTKKRRGQCLRRIFESFRVYDDESLNRRLNNIYWEV